MPIVEISGETARDEDNIGANPSRLINLYREPVSAGGKTRYILKTVLGSELFCEIGTVLGRTLGTVNGTLYAISGGMLCVVDATGAQSSLGSVVDDADAQIDGYNENVTITSGGNYYVYDGTTLSQIGGGAITSVGAHCYLSGYTVLFEENGKRVEWASLQDPKTRNALNVKIAEARDDKVLRGLEVNGNLWVFGEKSIEVWAVTGQANQDAFARIGGAVLGYGLKSKGLAVAIPGGVFFVDNSGIARVGSGVQSQPVSRTAIETAIKEGTPTRCSYYEDEGHKMAVIHFESRPAICYDLSTGEWHERGGADLGPWGVIATAKSYGKWLTLTESGRVGELKRVNTDLGETLRRRAISRTFEVGGKKFRVPLLEVRARTGFGNDYTDEIKFLFSTSKDDGVTFGSARELSLGYLGEYRTKAKARSLGQFESITLQIDLSEPCEVPIYADMRLEIA